MNFFKIGGLIIILIFHFFTSSSQSCQGFHKSSRCAVSGSNGFKQYGQARSALLEVGKVYTYKAVLYGRTDYIFSICSELGVKPLHFKIYDKTNNTVIFDNVDDDYNQTIGFTLETTINVEIEVEVLAEKKEKDPDQNRVCLGLQILWRKVPQTGFK